MVELNIFNRIMAVFSVLLEIVYYFTCTEQKAPHDIKFGSHVTTEMSVLTMELAACYPSGA
jgi:hypothetical protein